MGSGSIQKIYPPISFPCPLSYAREFLLTAHKVYFNQIIFMQHGWNAEVEENYNNISLRTLVPVLVLTVLKLFNQRGG